MNEYPDEYPIYNGVRPPLPRGLSLMVALLVVAPFLIASGAMAFMFWYTAAHGR